jgi:hypothetical protein
MQAGTLSIPSVVDNYDSNNWDEWIANCEAAGVYTIGIYGEGAVGQNLTEGQLNIVNYFEDPDWFDANPGFWNLYPARTGEPGYEYRQAFAEMTRMNAAIAECRAFADEEGYLVRINEWKAPDPIKIFGGL